MTWTSRPLPTIRSLWMLAPTEVLAGIGDGRIVVDTGGERDLDVLDASKAGTRPLGASELASASGHIPVGVQCTTYMRFEDIYAWSTTKE